MAEPREAPFGHEPPSVQTRRVLGVVFGLGIVVAVALVAMWLALAFWIMPGHTQLKSRPGMLPPAPRLQPHPDSDLARLRAQKRALLDGYAWTGGSHQYARIPIRRAMQLYVHDHAAGSGSGQPGPSSAATAAGDSREPRR